MSKKVYLVCGDTYFESYGSNISIFGIFDSKELADKAKTQKENDYFKNEKRQKHTCVEREDVHFEVIEMEINKMTDCFVGGYIE